MGYRDEIIRRLQDDGTWDVMDGQTHRRFQDLSDDQARQMMVLSDQWAMGEEEAIRATGLMALVRMIDSFQGKLVEVEGQKVAGLTKAGRLLAQFMIELSSEGLSPDEVEEGLSKLSPFAIAALIACYQATS